jgi:hypothetical protein
MGATLLFTNVYNLTIKVAIKSGVCGESYVSLMSFVAGNRDRVK